MNMYPRFIAMILTSTLVMFGLTYLNAYEPGHVLYSETRTYMALLMGAAMALLMLAFMLKMLPNRAANLAVAAASVAVFCLALWLVRSQTTVGQVSYMKAMIPHHSTAILTSERAEITDARVRALADQIMEAQREEILEMKALIRELESRH